MARKLRSVDSLLTTAVQTSIQALQCGPEDTAAVRLAMTYAAILDEAGAEALSDLGPKLLATLDALGATPKSRGTRKTPPSRAESRLEALRATRAV